MKRWGVSLVVLVLLAWPASQGLAKKPKSGGVLAAIGRTVAGPVVSQIPEGASEPLILRVGDVPVCLSVVNTGSGLVWGKVTQPSPANLFRLEPGQSTAYCTADWTTLFLSCNASSGRKSPGCTAVWRLDRYFGE